MGIIYADVPKARVRRHLRKGEIVPLTYVPPLTEEILDESVNIVAQMGVEPIQKALAAGCQVVLAGRCYDPAVFAALPISLGFDPGLALHMGKILECAAIAATPGSGADCAFGTLREGLLHPRSAQPGPPLHQGIDGRPHPLREVRSLPSARPGRRARPDRLHLHRASRRPGRGPRQPPRRRPSATGSSSRASRRSGFRTIAVAGTRDPIMIREIDAILDGVEAQVREILKAEDDRRPHPLPRLRQGRRHGRPGAREATSAATSSASSSRPSAPTQDDADALCSLTRSTLLHYGYPGRISTAGNLAFPFSPSDARMGEVFEFSIYHLMPRRPAGGFPDPDRRGPRRKGAEMKRSILNAAKVIRSKNSGPYELTLDIMFKDRAHFELFRRRNIVTKKKIAALYRRPVEDILKLVYFEPANALKITMRRPIPSGDAGRDRHLRRPAARAAPEPHVLRPAGP